MSNAAQSDPQDDPQIRNAPSDAPRRRRRTPAHPLLDALLHDESGARRPRYRGEELAARTPWERVYSVVPLLIKKAGILLKSIPARDRASGFELEDLVTIFAADLVEHDADWDRQYAYTTFVGLRTENLYPTLRGKARVVQSIRGNAQKLEAIAAARGENRCTARMRVSEANLHVAAAPIGPISEAGSLEWDSDTLAELEEEERMAGCRVAAMRHVRELPETPMVTILGLTLGATSRGAMNTKQIADLLGMTQARVSATRRKAEALLRGAARV